MLSINFTNKHSNAVTKFLQQWKSPHIAFLICLKMHIEVMPSPGNQSPTHAICTACMPHRASNLIFWITHGCNQLFWKQRPFRNSTVFRKLFELVKVGPNPLYLQFTSSIECLSYLKSLQNREDVWVLLLPSNFMKQMQSIDLFRSLKLSASACEWNSLTRPILKGEIPIQEWEAFPKSHENHRVMALLKDLAISNLWWFVKIGGISAIQ
jgi:hypothetical protein